MCGIVGIIAVDSNIYIEKLTSTLTHRGPDDEGIYTHQNISFGHRRLSVLDLTKNGHQPMISIDEKYILTFNGEIYNHLEIRKKLEPKYTFKSTTDTETLLYAFAEYGVNILPKLKGIFSFSFYDKLTGNVWIVRDQYGVKPLYYYSKDGNFIFSSELKAIVKYPHFKKDIDYNTITNYVNFSFGMGISTPFLHVKKVRPGHYIYLNIKSPQEFQLNKYNQIPFDGNYLITSEKSAIEQLEYKLQMAVERQLLSDAPLGYFLSGGIDSSAIVAMSNKIDPSKRLECFTINTGNSMKKEGFEDDLYYAKLVANHLNVNLNVIDANFNILENFDKMVYHLDEPIADPAALQVYNICNSAQKNGIKVLLGGTGGDELFSGYRRHQALRYETLFKYVNPSLGRLIKSSVSLLNSSNPLLRRIEKITTDIDKTKLERMMGYFNRLQPEKSKLLINPNLGIGVNDNFLLESLKDIPNEKNDLNRMLYWEIKSYLVDNNLTCLDKMSMAAGVESRVPFMDNDLVEFSTKLSPVLKLKNNNTKYILKKTMEKYLPKEIVYRSKTGFGGPIQGWLSNELQPLVNDYLSKKSILNRGIFDYDEVKRLVKDNNSNNFYPIWSLLVVESWFRQFAD